MDFILEHNNDLNTIKLVEMYILLIQDGLIDINNLITILQFVKMVNTKYAYFLLIIIIQGPGHGNTFFEISIKLILLSKIFYLYQKIHYNMSFMNITYDR